MASIRFIGTDNPERSHLILEQDGNTYLLGAEAVDHLISQHRDAKAGSLFDPAFLREPSPARGADTRFASGLLRLISDGLEARSFQAVGVSYQFETSSSVGVDAAVFGAQPEGYALKEQNGRAVLVPAVFGEAPPTKTVSAIIAPISGREQLPADLKNSLSLNLALLSGKLSSILTIFPGRCIQPDGSQIPNSSEMIGSNVCLIAQADGALRCSQNIAISLNAALAHIDAMLSFSEIEDSANALSAAAKEAVKRPAPAATEGYVCKAEVGHALGYRDESFITPSAQVAAKWASENYFRRIEIFNAAYGDAPLASTVWTAANGERHHSMKGLSFEFIAQQRLALSGWEVLSDNDSALSAAALHERKAADAARLKNTISPDSSGAGSVSFPLIEPGSVSAAPSASSRPPSESPLAPMPFESTYRKIDAKIDDKIDHSSSIDPSETEADMKAKLAQRRDPAIDPAPAAPSSLAPRASPRQ